MRELEGRFFGDEDAMYADIGNHNLNGTYDRSRMQYTGLNGNRVRWILYKGHKDQQSIMGVEFTKIMLDVSMVGLDLPEYHYILTRLRGRREK